MSPSFLDIHRPTSTACVLFFFAVLQLQNADRLTANHAVDIDQHGILVPSSINARRTPTFEPVAEIHQDSRRGKQGSPPSQHWRNDASQVEIDVSDEHPVEDVQRDDLPVVQRVPDREVREGKVHRGQIHSEQIDPVVRVLFAPNVDDEERQVTVEEPMVLAMGDGSRKLWEQCEIAEQYPAHSE